MRDKKKTKEQLLCELGKLRKQTAKSHESETKYKQTKKKLQECEEKYRNLVERANDGIAIIQDMVLKYVNPHMAKMVGYSVEK